MTTPLFSGFDLDKHLNACTNEALIAVQGLDRDHIQQADVAELEEAIVSEYERDAPRLLLDRICMLEPEEVSVDVSRHPRYAPPMRAGRRVHVAGSRHTVVVPFEGDARLLLHAPNRYTSNPPAAKLVGNELHFVYDLTPVDELTSIKPDYENRLKRINDYLAATCAQVGEYNRQLRARVRSAIEERRQRLLNDVRNVAGLGLPVRRRNDVSVYSPPSVRRKKPVVRPNPNRERHSPEPALPVDEFEHILRVVENLAIFIERSPRTFSRMKEQELRDQILVQLNGHYEGDATGETFSCAGKTDIFVRVDRREIFVAECKFWTGPKGHIETLDQLFSYTAWSNVFLAVVIFNQNKDHTQVLGRIGECSKEHKFFARRLPDRSETHQRYIFRHPQDPDREVEVAVLAFHLAR